MSVPQHGYNFEEVLAAARSAGLTIAMPQPPVDRFLAVNGVRLHWLDWGNTGKPDLLFIHGLGQQAHTWDFAALAVRHNYHALSVSLRGHGDSEHSPDGVYRLERYVDDILAFIDTSGLKRPVLCGLSLGGRVAYMAASRRPDDLAGLVVVDTAPEISEEGRQAVRRFMSASEVFDSFEVAIELVSAYNARRSRDVVAGSLRNNLRQLPDGRWTWKYDPLVRSGTSARPEAVAQQWAALGRVHCPTLFITGGSSRMVSGDAIERALGVVKGSRHVAVPNAGHLVPGDNPSGFVASLEAFLASLPNAGQATTGAKRTASRSSKTGAP